MLSAYARSLLLIPRRGYDVMTGVKVLLSCNMKLDSEGGKAFNLVQLGWTFDSISCSNVDDSVNREGVLTPINLPSHLLCSNILTVTKSHKLELRRHYTERGGKVCGLGAHRSCPSGYFFVP